MKENCPICKRPAWNGGHALNDRECSEREGEVCLLVARVAKLEAELALEKKLKTEALYQAELEAGRANEADPTLERLGTLLTGVAVSFRGPEPELTMYDWSDLPDRAKAATARIAALEAREGPTEQGVFQKALAGRILKEEDGYGPPDDSYASITFWVEAGVGGSHRGLVTAVFNADGSLNTIYFCD